MDQLTCQTTMGLLAYQTTDGSVSLWNTTMDLLPYEPTMGLLDHQTTDGPVSLSDN